MSVRIYIDKTPFTVKEGKNLLETSLALGIYVPHFCYHAALGSVGACRLCAVKKFRDPADQKGRIVMACMEPIAEGLIVSVKDPDAVIFRKAVIESLMINHPHDCPVCDEGGECHLQDMTVMTGHNYRRFGFKKRTYVNQNLGPFINHEMNRCIQCYRCVRFYNDYAGGGDLGVFGAHDQLYFGRQEDGTLESEFSGNLVEVCPTGVFTDKTLKNHFIRKWDLTNAPSVCVHCSLGCNIIGGERYGELRRIMNRYNGEVNGYFLCDRGRFGYEFVNDAKRIRIPKAKAFKDDDALEISPEGLAEKLGALSAKPVIGIGSPRASLEANFALSRLAGDGNFYHGISRKEQILVRTALEIMRKGNVHGPSLKEIEKADAIFILGEDLTNTAPVAALAVRQAIRNKSLGMAAKNGIPLWNDYPVREMAQDSKSPLFIAMPIASKLDSIATGIYRASAEEIARLGFAVASGIHANSPAVKNMDDESQLTVQKISAALLEAERPLIITGTHSGSQHMLHAASNIAQALSIAGKIPSLFLILPECNSMGLAMMPGNPLEDAIERVRNGEIEQVIILENDLYRRVDKDQADILFNLCKKVIVIDHLENESTKRADILLPAGTFAESEGSLVNNEGRAQRFYSILPPSRVVIESWRQIRNIMQAMGIGEADAWETFDDIVKAMTEAFPAFAPIRNHLPNADFRLLNEKIKRQTIRYSGRTSILANVNVSEPKVPDDPDSPLAFTMEGSDEKPPSSLVSYYWMPGWNSYQAMNFYMDEPNGSMKGGDPGIRLIQKEGSTSSPFYAPEGMPFKPQPGKWMGFPVYHIFGSEELSSAGKTMALRIPAPFIFLNAHDAESLGSRSNDTLEFASGKYTWQFNLRIENSIPDGMAGFSTGLPGLSYLELPIQGSLVKIQRP